MSSAVCILGMNRANYYNDRSSRKRREYLSIAETVTVALCGGSISDPSVQAVSYTQLMLQTEAEV